jgi:outer membrane immunogenic protein
MKIPFAFLLAVAAVSIPASCLAQTASPEHANPAVEVALNYAWVHTNAPPGGCGCFPMNGGGADAAYAIRKSSLSVVADLSVVTQSNVDSTGNSLTLTSFTGGLRYRVGRGAWQPFGEVLAGGAHASGNFAPYSIASPTNAGLAFAANVGGGLDRRLNSHWSLRLVQADYYVTTFGNRSNNHQNNVRLGAGIVVHFGH